VNAACQLTSANNVCQVHVLESQQRESAVAIGVAGRNYALDQMPGWQDGSIAYHLDDGNLFVQVRGHCSRVRARGGGLVRARGANVGCSALSGDGV